MDLEGRIALVTGASRGIGRAIAEVLAAEGAAVAVNYRSSKAGADEVVEAIASAGGRAVAVPGDVASYDEAQAMVQQAVDELGGLHILVNNAGVSKDALIFNMEPEDWLDVMRVNFGGVFNCTKAVLGHFMSERDGVIVNISSVMGERGWIGESNYAASKGAINAFTRCSAVELARFGVRVNAVLPGFAPTELVGGLVEKDGGKGILRQIPLKAFATGRGGRADGRVPRRSRRRLHDRRAPDRRRRSEHRPRSRGPALSSSRHDTRKEKDEHDMTCHKAVQEAVMGALSVSEDEATPDATLMDDLGAESIDLLDILFRVERSTGVKIAGLRSRRLHPGRDPGRPLQRRERDDHCAKGWST